MKIRKDVIIALNTLSLLKALARVEFKVEYSRSEDLADLMKTSHAQLEQIMRKLAIAGIVNKKRGPGGGYMYIRPTNALDVAKALGYKPKVYWIGSPENVLMTQFVQAMFHTVI